MANKPAATNATMVIQTRAVHAIEDRIHRLKIHMVGALVLPWYVTVTKTMTLAYVINNAKTATKALVRMSSLIDLIHD